MNEDKQNRIHVACEQLEAAGITYHTNNGGVHLKITSPSGRSYDLWPTTDRWGHNLYGKFRHGSGGLERLLRLLSAEQRAMQPSGDD